MNKIINFILDIIFPKQCLQCGQDDLWLCNKCFEKINLLNKQTCPICRIKNNGETCKKCTSHSNLDGLLVATSLNEQLIQKLIHNFKYKYITDLRYPLSKLLLKTFNKYLNNDIKLKSEQYVFIPMPLYKKRLLERGFNQSNLLASSIAKKTNSPYNPNIIYRGKNTETQTKLSRKERILNVKSAFKINKSLDFINKNVIIIDDVATTLSTLEECAEILKKAGVKKIWGLVIARGDL
ncbi:MAG: ComF family protein [Candidatus Kerfeldbacteria bacterium]